MGRTFPVLVEQRQEGSGGEVLWTGYTPNFLRVATPGGPDDGLENQVGKFRLKGVNRFR